MAVLASAASDTASSFECPVCYDYVLPPIVPCLSGHIVCSKCLPKLTSCPTCRGSLGNIRNNTLEQIAHTVLFPCKYAPSGCTMRLLPTVKGVHEEACEFAPIKCPYPGASCHWQGSLEQVLLHLKNTHTTITYLQGTVGR